LTATVNWPWFPCMVANEAAMLSITARRSAIYSATVLAVGGVDVAMATRVGRVGRKLGVRQRRLFEVARRRRRWRWEALDTKMVWLGIGNRK
jgi:hypothetical protein